jgi:hypothetical protein
MAAMSMTIMRTMMMMIMMIMIKKTTMMIVLTKMTKKTQKMPHTQIQQAISRKPQSSPTKIQLISKIKERTVARHMQYRLLNYMYTSAQ